MPNWFNKLLEGDGSAHSYSSRRHEQARERLGQRMSFSIPGASAKDVIQSVHRAARQLDYVATGYIRTGLQLRAGLAGSKGKEQSFTSEFVVEPLEGGVSGWYGLTEFTLNFLALDRMDTLEADIRSTLSQFFSAVEFGSFRL